MKEVGAKEAEDIYNFCRPWQMPFLIKILLKIAIGAKFKNYK